nr:odorant binding protein 1 [Pagiophloeus tsushimanus]
MSLVWVLGFTYTLTGLLFIQSYGSTDNPRLNAWFKSCQEKTAASDKDYEMIKMRKIPSSTEGVCMVECLFNKLHIIDNGKFNKRGFVITFSPVVKGDLKKLSTLKEIARICDEQISTATVKDDCDVTKMVLDCFGRNMDKLDLSKKS